jgi:23S rRNA (adenine2503-C2)-methyltransferase
METNSPKPSLSNKKLRNIRDVEHDELSYIVKQLGQPAFRVKQIEEWIWKNGVRSYDEMTNVPKALRESLSNYLIFDTPQEIAKSVSNDGSRKYLLQYADGTNVECVGMPSGDRLSVCVSTQAGCPMGCIFCATGNSGFKRSLTAAQIYDQVLHAEKDFGQRVSSVVLMGQGEPFMNYDQTLKAMRLMNRADALAIGARHITVSTCGIVPKIQKFANEPEQFTLAISLHSAVQKTRDVIMPGVKKYNLQLLKHAIDEYTTKTKRRPTYEYAMIDGVNDTDEDLEALVAFCEGTLCHVNLIQLNDLPGSPLKPSKMERVNKFRNRLKHAGVETTVRESRGNDIEAACGQLSQKYGK